MRPDITSTDVYTAVRAFLLGILPADVEVVRGQQNRVPEPTAENFVTMIELGRMRLSTQELENADCAFMGLIDGESLWINEMLVGSVRVGATIFGDDVTPGTTILEAGEGEGEYIVSESQDIPFSKLAAGSIDYGQSTKLTMQLDVHGPDSAENVQVISTMFRSVYAADTFAAGVSPLMCSDPRQMPFFNEAQQVEQRWSIDLELQINPTIATPQQFADEVVVVNSPGDV